MSARSLETHPIHLGNGGTAVPQPEFPRDERAMQWYVDYGARNAEDGEDGRLVSCFRFTEDWAGWDMHPAGAEVVVCIDGIERLAATGFTVSRVELAIVVGIHPAEHGDSALLDVGAGHAGPELFVVAFGDDIGAAAREQRQSQHRNHQTP